MILSTPFHPMSRLGYDEDGRVNPNVGRNSEGRLPFLNQLGWSATPAFAVDVLSCPTCQGRMKLLTLVRDHKGIAGYLATVGETNEVPRRSPGRGPPHW